jgi:hypothetical protein
MMVFISNGKLHVSAYMPNKGILYKTLIARKLSKLEDGLYRPKHVDFHC